MSEDESEDDKGRSCCCQGLIQQRKRKISDVEKINAEMKQRLHISLYRGEVTAAKGFNAGGMYDGLRASKEKPDLGIVTCDVDAVPADN
ncbi:hypothetical protein Bca52824_075107 [Brassica carinata]|uniref:Uncharacterized protein n=1 Tax=Brassica carinata TaxID=52824 RepID=A0A8X7PSD0_BRACI|nr:hypothetical protein Bca52824_075107 [Brassica carinata]